MTLCPIAIVSGCKKCPFFAVCPLKTVIGDHKKDEPRNCCTKNCCQDKAEKEPGES